jgi:hypothetical protein
LVNIADYYPFAHYPFVKILLGSIAEIQHMRNFGKNSDSAYIPVRVFPEKSLDGTMMLLTIIKKGN